MKFLHENLCDSSPVFNLHQSRPDVSVRNGSYFPYVVLKSRVIRRLEKNQRQRALRAPCCCLAISNLP